MKLSDKDFDSLIRIAMLQLPADDDLPTNQELIESGISLHVFTPSFEKRMNKLFRSIHRKAHINTFGRMHHKLKLVMLSTVLTAIFCIITVSAHRYSIANFILNLGGSSSNITFDRSSLSISKTFDKYLPTYTPEGFYIESVQETPSENIYIQFTDGQNKFYDIECSLKLSNISVDTEHGKITKLKIHGSDAVISERNDRIISTYIVGNIFYSLSGNIDTTEILSILQSIPII